MVLGKDFMVNRPGTYLLLQSKDQGLSLQTKIRRCSSGSAGCTEELALQIGGAIFRANATGTFLEGQPVAKLCGKASATKTASCSFVQLVDENDVMVDHPMFKLVIHEDQSTANFIEYTFKPGSFKPEQLAGTSGMLGSKDNWPAPKNSPCKQCKNGVCMCTNWKIGAQDGCRIHQGEDKKPFEVCHLKAVTMNNELDKESSEKDKITHSDVYQRKLKDCKATLEALVPQRTTSGLSDVSTEKHKVLDELFEVEAEDCAFDGAEGSPDSKTMLQKSFCDAVEEEVDPDDPDPVLCKTVLKCKNGGHLPIMSRGGKSCRQSHELQEEDLQTSKIMETELYANAGVACKAALDDLKPLVPPSDNLFHATDAAVLRLLRRAHMDPVGPPLSLVNKLFEKFTAQCESNAAAGRPADEKLLRASFCAEVVDSMTSEHPDAGLCATAKLCEKAKIIAGTGSGYKAC